MRGIREFLENAGDKLKKATYTQRIQPEDCDQPADELEFDRIGAIAHRRGIDVRFEFQLYTCYEYSESYYGPIDYDADVSDCSFSRFYWII